MRREGNLMCEAAKPSRTLCDVVHRALRDVTAAAGPSGLSDVDSAARELHRIICAYWCPDHGISARELPETDRDAIAAERKRRRSMPG